MRAWLAFLLFACFVSQTIGRPQQLDYSNDINIDQEEEEDDIESAADDAIADEEDMRLNEQELAISEEEIQHNRHQNENRYMQRDAAESRPTRTYTDNFSDYKPNANRGANSNGQFRSSIKIRQSNKYVESNDPNDLQEATQRLSSRDVNKQNIARRLNTRDNSILINKESAEFNKAANEEGDMIFQNSKEQESKMDKNEYNSNEALDASEQSRYPKQYYNTRHTENRGMTNDNTHESSHYGLRDRRDAKDIFQSDTDNSQNRKENLDKSANEDEESAIKRHIKKLSVDELEQLLNSLSEEKRDLLKKIINDGDTTSNGYVNKREITKKSGAVEENNFVENGQSDLSKVQGSPSIDVNSEFSESQTSETTEAVKQTDAKTESYDLSSSKTADTSNVSEYKAELISHNDKAVEKKSDINTFSSNLDSKNQVLITANAQVTSKTENKRETNLKDLENIDSSFDDSVFLSNDLNLKDGQDYSNDEGYFCSPDENLSQFLDDETSNHNEDSKTYKREAYLEKESDLADSMKSLEESFPNSNAYDDSEPYSGPLIRVKRKNSDQIVKKRSAALLTDAKVAYFPYKAENEDEDNDEGNEFDDEGFYDRTSNFANGNKASEDDASDNSDSSKQFPKADTEDPKSPSDNPESDTMSLGSDTDSVLSGVEGVDDNLMYSSGSRNRRAAGDNSSYDASANLSNSLRSLSLTDDLMNTGSRNYNLPHYQESDAFGPLPRSYEGDLARFKRIRQVKQSHSSDEPSSNLSV